MMPSEATARSLMYLDTADNELSDDSEVVITQSLSGWFSKLSKSRLVVQVNGHFLKQRLLI